MNIGTFNNNLLENIVPPWLLPCSCDTQRCHCNAKYKPNILYVKGLAYQSQPPNKPDPNLQIQFIKFTYTKNRFFIKIIQQKINKYILLIEETKDKGWTVCPIIVITIEAWGSIHMPSLEIIQQEYHIKETSLHETFTNINTISIHYQKSIILHKRRIENNQSFPQIDLPP